MLHTHPHWRPLEWATQPEYRHTPPVPAPGPHHLVVQSPPATQPAQAPYVVQPQPTQPAPPPFAYPYGVAPPPYHMWPHPPPQAEPAPRMDPRLQDPPFIDPYSEDTKRWVLEPQDALLLERVFALEKTPGRELRAQLARRLGVMPRQVQVWFQNKRQRTRNGAKPTVAEAIALSMASAQDPEQLLISVTKPSAENGSLHDAGQAVVGSGAAAIADAAPRTENFRLHRDNGKWRVTKQPGPSDGGPSSTTTGQGAAQETAAPVGDGDAPIAPLVRASSTLSQTAEISLSTADLAVASASTAAAGSDAGERSNAINAIDALCAASKRAQADHDLMQLVSDDHAAPSDHPSPSGALCATGTAAMPGAHASHREVPHEGTACLAPH